MGYSCRTLLWDSCRTLLWDTSSLQNERFVRDFLQKSHVKSPKRACRTRLPPKVKRKHPSEHTHHAALPSSFASPAPPNNTRSHANPTVTATFTSTTTHTLTIPCACHESFRIHTSNAQSTAPATKCHLRRTSQPHHSLRLPRDTLKGHSCGTLLYETLVGYSCRTLLWDTLVGHSCGTRQVSKTGVSYETSSKSHASSLQNERFVRDFLQNSHVKIKREFRTRLPPKVQRQHPSEHTHHAALPSSFATPAPPNNTRSHANPNVTATFTSTTTHDLTIPCACHESFRIHTSNAHKVLRLPRQVTSVTPRNLTISCAYHTKFAPHHTFGMISTRSEHTPIHQNQHFS